MTDPTNYIIGQANPTPFASLTQGFQLGNAIQTDQMQRQQQAIQLQQAQQQQALLSNLANNPNATAADYAHVMIAIPAVAESLQKAWTTKNTAQQQATTSDALQWGSAIINGQPQVAADAMNAQADAIEASAGGPTPQSQALRTHAQVTLAHPQFALGQIQALLAANPNGQQAATTLGTLIDNQKKTATLPADVAKANADATKATADATVATNTVPANSAAPGINNAKTVADANLTNTTAGINTGNYNRQPGAVNLPDSALSIINKSADDAVSARQSAAQYTDLANQLDTANPQSLGGGTAEALKNFTGQQNYVSSLRQEYVRLRAGEGIKSLPPGAASDADIKNMMAGFPSETASPATLASFLRGMAKAKNYEAQVADAKSEWVNSVGSLGKPTKDIQIGNTLVPAGTTFSTFAGLRLKPVGAVTQPAAPAAGTAAALIAKYGGGSPAAAPVAPVAPVAQPDPNASFNSAYGGM